MSDDAIYSSCAGNLKRRILGSAILRLLGLMLNGGMVMCSGRVVWRLLGPALYGLNTSELPEDLDGGF